MRGLNRKVVLLTEDDIVARQLEQQAQSDGMDLVRARTAAEAWLAINRLDPKVLIVDLTSRSLDGHQLVSLSAHARQRDVPLLLMSKQTRRDLASFAAVLKARDVLCKGEPLTNLGARIRMWVASVDTQLAAATASL